MKLSDIFSEDFINGTKKFISTLSQQINNFLKHPEVQSFFTEMKQWYDNLPDNIKKSVLKLAEYGWYVDLEVIDIYTSISVNNHITSENDHEINQWLCEEYEKNIDAIQKKIQEKYPKRSQIIEKAFTAHKNKDYELSIPVLFTQIDGICVDETDKEFFRSSNGKPRIAEYFKSIAIGEVQNGLLQPLMSRTSINHSPKEREGKNNTLNRHQILHGEVVDYATRVNSFKCISLINYLSNILLKINESKNGDKDD